MIKIKEMDEKINALTYRRVSTEDQVSNLCLSNQNDYCLRKAAQDKAQILSDFCDEGIPATSIERPALKEMMEFCEKNKGLVNRIYIYNIERLSRITKDYIWLKAFFTSLG